MAQNLYVRGDAIYVVQCSASRGKRVLGRVIPDLGLWFWHKCGRWRETVGEIARCLGQKQTRHAGDEMSCHQVEFDFMQILCHSSC